MNTWLIFISGCIVGISINSLAVLKHIREIEREARALRQINLEIIDIAIGVNHKESDELKKLVNK